MLRAQLVGAPRQRTQLPLGMGLAGTRRDDKHADTAVTDFVQVGKETCADCTSTAVQVPKAGLSGSSFSILEFGIHFFR